MDTIPQFRSLDDSGFGGRCCRVWLGCGFTSRGYCPEAEVRTTSARFPADPTRSHKRTFYPGFVASFKALSPVSEGWFAQLGLMELKSRCHRAGSPRAPWETLGQGLSHLLAPTPLLPLPHPSGPCAPLGHLSMQDNCPKPPARGAGVERVSSTRTSVSPQPPGPPTGRPQGPRHSQ